MINFDLIYVEGFEPDFKAFYSFLPKYVSSNGSDFSIFHTPGKVIVTIDTSSLSSTTVKLKRVQYSIYKIIGIKF